MNKLKKTLSVLLIAAFMLSTAGCSMIDYKKAEKLKNDGDYAAAQEMYIALGDIRTARSLPTNAAIKSQKPHMTARIMRLPPDYSMNSAATRTPQS